MQTTEFFIMTLAAMAIAGIIFALKRKKSDLPPPPHPYLSTPVEPREELKSPEEPPSDITYTVPEETEIPLMIDLLRPTPEAATAEEPVGDMKNGEAQNLLEQFGQYDPHLDLASYQYPSLNLLEPDNQNTSLMSDEALTLQKEQLIATLNLYGVQIDQIKATPGPTITLFEITPAPGVRIATVKKLENDIALSLSAIGTKVIGHLPGKGTIGIEVPNKEPQIVTMRSVLASENFQQSKMNLPVILGKTMDNTVYIADLSRMPHLLIAGATGQGKSVGINAILTSLLCKKHPSEVKFVLIDINQLELTLYRNIERHFLAALPEGDAIVTRQDKVVDTLTALLLEMDQRLELLSSTQVRNIRDYNEKIINRQINYEQNHRFLPYIVVVIDEFADLVSPTDKTPETMITRIAQMGRATGIHLIISTQRPATLIITGNIKANFPARLAFRLSSGTDSRTIFDTNGAEQLQGNGDLLYMNGTELMHLQGTYISTDEVEKICGFIAGQRGYPSAMYLPNPNPTASQIKDFDKDHLDPMFWDAARLIVLHQQGSTSLIQRKMKLGYNRAGRIIDQLEAAGIIGPFDGSKAREVLFFDEYTLEKRLEKFNPSPNT